MLTFSSSGLATALCRSGQLTSLRRSFQAFAARSTFLGDNWLGSLLCSRHNPEPRSLSQENNNLHLFEMDKTESLCYLNTWLICTECLGGLWKHTGPRRGAITKPVLGTASEFRDVGVTIIALAGPGKGARKINRQWNLPFSIHPSSYLYLDQDIYI